MNQNLRSLLSIVVLLALGVGSWGWIVSVEEPPLKAPPRDLGPVPVSTRPVVGRDLLITLEAFGNLEARHRVTLAAEVPGRIVEVLGGWRPGAEVSAGELLVKLDARLFELDLQAAEANAAESRAGVEAARVSTRRAERSLENALERLTVSEREYERLVGLAGISSESLRDASLRGRIEAESARDEAEGARDASAAALASARARDASADVRVALAREQLLRTEIRAPFDGRLRGQAPGLGGMVLPGTPLGELLDPGTLVLTVRVPETDLLAIRPGQSASLILPSTPETLDGPRRTARVVAVDAASDARTRRGIVELELEAPPGSADSLIAASDRLERPLPAGLFARAEIELEHLTGALWVARRHIAWEGGQAVAYVLEPNAAGPLGDGQAGRRVLRLGREHGEGFLVLGGLVEGDTLILGPLDRMSPGVAVRKVNESEGPPPGGSLELR